MTTEKVNDQSNIVPDQPIETLTLQLSFSPILRPLEPTAHSRWTRSTTLELEFVDSVLHTVAQIQRTSSNSRKKPQLTATMFRIHSPRQDQPHTTLERRHQIVLSVLSKFIFQASQIVPANNNIDLGDGTRCLGTNYGK